ncbi:MAG: hypothetical protein P8L68_19110 [Paracoccaceae bacterium]|nr:hypothetical protein [Paracoccaceae bacterium]
MRTFVAPKVNGRFTPMHIAFYGNVKDQTKDVRNTTLASPPVRRIIEQSR